MALYFLSLYADLRVLRSREFVLWVWKLLSIVSLLASILAYEVTLPLFFWLFRVLSGRRSQIEFPTVEVDGVDEVLLIAETARRGLDPLNP